jgi:hypothetical protein
MNELLIKVWFVGTNNEVITKFIFADFSHNSPTIEEQINSKLEIETAENLKWMVCDYSDSDYDNFHEDI